MARFVHLTAEKYVASIRKVGIKATDTGLSFKGIYAMPVVRNFYVSHQWLRELKRFKKKNIYGIYFVIPDTQTVLVGHYNQHQLSATAAQALGMLMKLTNAEGYEVIIPRPIQAKEITRIRLLPQVLGWRYMPGSHDRKPCGCPVCLPKGSYKSRKIRERFEENL